MNLMIQKKNGGGLSMKKLVICNSGTIVFIIEGKMLALNSSSDVKGSLVPYKSTNIDQQDYAVSPSEHFPSI